jgi:rubrerythrin
MNNSSTPQTHEDLLIQALAIERDAVARYEELADIMAMPNNAEVAALFRKMAQIESLHVAQVLAELGWAEDTIAPRQPPAWRTPEAPETVPLDEMHYLMHPWHALQLALAAEERARDFFAHMAEQAPNDALRLAAEDLRDEEAAHVELVQAWIARVPPPGPEWSVDPDPPRYID